MQRNLGGPRQVNLGDPDVGPVPQMLSLGRPSGCEIMLYRHVQARLTQISTCPGASLFEALPSRLSTTVLGLRFQAHGVRH